MPIIIREKPEKPLSETVISLLESVVNASLERQAKRQAALYKAVVTAVTTKEL